MVRQVPVQRQPGDFPGRPNKMGVSAGLGQLGFNRSTQHVASGYIRPHRAVDRASICPCGTGLTREWAPSRTGSTPSAVACSVYLGFRQVQWLGVNLGSARLEAVPPHSRGHDLEPPRHFLAIIDGLQQVRVSGRASGVDAHPEPRETCPQGDWWAADVGESMGETVVQRRIWSMIAKSRQGAAAFSPPARHPACRAGSSAPVTPSHPR